MREPDFQRFFIAVTFIHKPVCIKLSPVMKTTLILIVCCASTLYALDFTELSDVSRLSEFGLMDLFHDENAKLKGKRSKRQVSENINDHLVKAIKPDTVFNTKLELEEERLMEALSSGFSMSYNYNEPKTAMPTVKQTSSPTAKLQRVKTEPPTMIPSRVSTSNAPSLNPSSKKVEPTPSSSSPSLQPKEIHLTTHPTTHPSKAPSEAGTPEKKSIMLCSGYDDSAISPQSPNIVETYTYLYIMETAGTPSEAVLERIDAAVQSGVVANFCRKGSIRRNLVEAHRFLSFVGVNRTTTVTILQSPSCSPQSVNDQCNGVQGQVETIQRADEAVISSEQMMTQVQGVFESINRTLVQDGSVVSISFVGSSWPTSPPSTPSSDTSNSESLNSNNNAAIGAGVGAFVILVLGMLAGILNSRRKGLTSVQKSSNSSVAVEENLTFDDDSTCSSGLAPESSSITSMTFVNGTAKALDAKSTRELAINGSDGNRTDVSRIIVLNHEGYDAETTVNKKTFDDGDVIQELHEF